MFFANILSNIVFLLLRSCSNSRINITLTEDHEQTIDMLEQQQILLGLCSSYVSPFIVTFSIVNSGWDEYEYQDSSIKSFTKFMMAIQALQALIILYITFVSYRRDTSPDQGGETFFNKYMPIGHYILSLILFVVTPVTIVIAYVSVSLSSVNTGLLFSYLTFYTILSLLLMFWFFASHLDVFDRLKHENRLKRALINQ